MGQESLKFEMRSKFLVIDISDYIHDLLND